ncbi:MAG: amino acid ABC transporter ATP-binding protein [Clostridia bacterium]|nr:amino acid ABC transporter ATP-binding protein [Clostridia bacterium]
MLTAENIYKKYGNLEVLRGVSLTVNKGDVVALIGQSGSGKSTFLRCLNQLERVDSGTIRMDDLTLCEMENGKLRYAKENVQRAITLKMGMVFQSFNLFPHMSVLQNLIDAPMHVLKKKKDEAVAQARKMLSKVGLADRENQYPYQLSGGQAQRVAIARALCMNPEILCFDEPTSALDPLLTKEVLSVMKELAAERMTMVVVTHEMDFARDVADRVVFMENGTVVEDNPPEILFASQNPRTRRFLGLG